MNHLLKTAADRLHVLAREVGLIALARGVVIACQFINIKLYTNYLSAEQLGVYFFLLTISFLANALIFGPVDYYQQANLAKIIKITGGVRPLLEFNLKLIAVCLVIAFLVSVVGMIVVPNFVYHIVLAVALSIALYVVIALRNTLNNLGHTGDVSFSLVQEAVVKIVMFIALVNFFEPDELLLATVWLISLMTTAIFLFWRSNQYSIFNCGEKYLVEAKEIFHFSYPLSVGAICNWIQLQGYRLILVPFGFAEVVGIFATIASIGSAAMAAAATIFSQSFSPLIYKTFGEYTKTYLRNALTMITSILLAGLLLGAWVVQLATNPTFAPYWAILIFGVLTDATNLLIGALSIHITLTSNTRTIMLSSVLGVITLAASFALIFCTNNISAYTIGLPLIFSQVVVLTVMYWSFKKCKIN